MKLSDYQKRHKSIDSSKERGVNNTSQAENSSCRPEEFQRSRMYSHKRVEDCLKPMNLENITPEEHYRTETMR